MKAENEDEGPRERTDDLEPEAGSPVRRDFLKGVTSLALGHLAVSFLGSAPHAASPAAPLASCGAVIPNSGGSVYPDADCRAPSGTTFEKDDDCGKQEATGVPHYDSDCSWQATTGGSIHTDGDCGVLNETDNSTGMDSACSMLKPDGSYLDDDCGKPVPGGRSHDLNCAKPHGELFGKDARCHTNVNEASYLDESCGLISPAPGSPQQLLDLDCSRVVQTQGGPQSDSLCAQPHGDYFSMDLRCVKNTDDLAFHDASCNLTTDEWGWAESPYTMKDHDCGRIVQGYGGPQEDDYVDEDGG